MITPEVYDIECLCNLFTYTGYDYKEDKWYQFVISNWRNDYKELYKHLTENKILQIDPGEYYKNKNKYEALTNNNILEFRSNASPFDSSVSYLPSSFSTYHI